MGWFFDEYSRFHGFSPGVVTGKPLELHGSEGRISATGRGCVFALRETLKSHHKGIEGQRVAVQGFGNVGSWGALLLHAQGAKLVAVSDVRGGIFAGDGLDIPRVIEHVQRTGSVIDFPGTVPITNEELLTLPCDVLMPAALGHVLTETNAPHVKAQFVLEGANSPCSAEADQIFEQRNIVCIPDIFANAGGVTVSYFEWVQNQQNFKWSEARVNDELDRIMTNAYARICLVMQNHKLSMRGASFVHAVARVKSATDLRGLH
jgi:glutamate dehydrogenase (NAD(P)+)